MPRRPPNRAADVAVGVVLLLAATSGVVLGDWIRNLQLCCDDPRPTTSMEYLTSALAEVITALALVTLGGFVVVVLQRTRWLWLLIGAATAVLLVLALAHQQQAGTAPADGSRVDPVTTVIFVLYMPPTWPLLVVTVSSVVIAVLRVPLRRREVDTTR
jgi:hypothetical protein